MAKGLKKTRTLKERQDKREQVQGKWLAKIARKEKQQLKALIKAARKARLLEIGKLKRRLKLKLQSENSTVSEEAPAVFSEEQDGKSGKNRARFDTADEESIRKQLQAAQRIDPVTVARQACASADFETIVDGEDPQEQGESDDAEEEDPLQVLFASRMLKSRVMTQQLQESKAIVSSKRADFERWNQRRDRPAELAKKARKAWAKEKERKGKAPATQMQQAPTAVQGPTGGKRKSTTNSTKEGKREGFDTDEALHPSWAAKKHKSGMLGVIPQPSGKKIVFGD